MSDQGRLALDPPRLGLRRRLLRGGTLAGAARLLAFPVGLVTAMLVSRLLPPSEVGAYFLLISLATLLSFVAQGGLARAMVRLVATMTAAGRPAAARNAIRLGLMVTGIGGGLVAILLLTGPGSWLMDQLQDAAQLRPLLALLAALVIAMAFVDFAAESLRGAQAIGAASLLGNLFLQRLLFALVLAALWLGEGKPDLGIVLTGTVAAAGLSLLVAGVWLVRRLGTFGRGGDALSPTEVLRLGPPFLLLRVQQWLMAGADLWVLGWFRPIEEVALYGAASRVALLISTPIVIFSGVVAPLVAELHTQSQIRVLERLLRTTASVATLPSLLGVGVLALFGEIILARVFTEAYVAGAMVLLVLALGQFIHVAFGACGIALNMTGHQNAVVVVSLVSSIAGVIALVLVAPRFGMVGVAVVTASGLLAQNLALAILARRRLGIATWLYGRPHEWLGLIPELRRAVRI